MNWGDVQERHFDKLLLSALFCLLLAVVIVFAFCLPSANGYKEFVLQAAAGVLGALIQSLRGPGRSAGANGNSGSVAGKA